MMIHGLCIAVLLILLRWQYQDIMLDKRQKTYSIHCIILTLIVVMAEAGCILTDNTVPENRVWSILFNTIGFGISPFVFLIESKFYDLGQSKPNRFIYIPAFLNLLLVSTSDYSGLVFYVDENCKYNRGPLFFIYVLTFAFSIFVTMVRKIQAIRNYPRYFRSRIIGSTCLMLFGLVIQVVFPKYVISWMIISMYLVLYYALSCETGSMIDGLTGLLNRAAFNKMMSNHEHRKNKQYFLIMLDVNDFKTINDTKGHTYGDFCLKEIAATLMEVFTANAHVFRFGGDEFTVLLKAGQSTAVDAYLEKVQIKIAQKREQYPIFPNIAAGYAMLESGTELRDTIDQADAQMYQNKQNMKAK